MGSFIMVPGCIAPDGTVRVVQLQYIINLLLLYCTTVCAISNLACVPLLGSIGERQIHSRLPDRCHHSSSSSWQLGTSCIDGCIHPIPWTELDLLCLYVVINQVQLCKHLL